jgi:hypothetical protein
MEKYGFHYCKMHEHYVCGSCKVPRFHGNPKDNYKFYKTSAKDKPEEYRTEDPKNYCLNHKMINGEFICLGHYSDNTIGLGEVDQNGFHGSIKH